MAKAQLLIEDEKTDNERKLEWEIEQLENDIDDAEFAVGEEWFRIAMDIKGIKERYATAKKKKERLFGFKTFEEYCMSDRSRYSKAHSYRLLEAADIRGRIPSPRGDGIVWTERAVRPLTALVSPQSQVSAAKAALKKAEAAEEAGETLPLGRAVKQEVERIQQTTAYKRAEEKRQQEKLANASPTKNIQRLITYTRKHLLTLQSQQASFWNAVEAEEPGLAVRAAEALEELAAFLRE